MIKASRQDFLKSVAVGSVLVAAAGPKAIATAIAGETPKVVYTGGYKAGTAVNDYRALFDCDVRFGRNENAIAFSGSNLTEARLCADPRASERLETDLVHAIQAKSKHIELSTAIEAWMTAAISAGASIDLENVASDCGLSLRSLPAQAC